MVHNPFIQPYFFGGGHWGVGPLDSHDGWLEDDPFLFGGQGSIFRGLVSASNLQYPLDVADSSLKHCQSRIMMKEFPDVEGAYSVHKATQLSLGIIS